MFFTHVVNLHAGKCSVCQRTFKCLTRMIGVHMYFYDFIICDKYDGISDGSKEFLERMFFFNRHRFVQKNDKLSAVSELDVCFCLWRDPGNCSCTRFLEIGIIYIFTEEAINCSSQNFQKALSARVYYTCFFQYREHFWCTGKRIFCVIKYCMEKWLKFFCFRCNLGCFESSFLCNSQDSSFFWFHNCFVCSLNRFFHGRCNGKCIQFFRLSYASCKSTKKLGKNNTGVSSCTT